MAALRTLQIWRGVASSGSWTTVYTVPAGYVVVVDAVTLQHEDTGSAAALLGASGTYIFNVPLTAWGTSGGHYEWRGKAVLSAGQTVQVACSTGKHVDYVIGGKIYFV